MDKTLEAVVNRHLAAENAHRMRETLAELHPDCAFEDPRSACALASC